MVLFNNRYLLIMGLEKMFWSEKMGSKGYVNV